METIKLSEKEWLKKRNDLYVAMGVPVSIESLNRIMKQFGFECEEQLSTENEERLKHFLNQLPDGYRERALAQIDYKRLEEFKVYHFMCDAIVGFCEWDATKEGEDFWKQVCFHYFDGTPLPPLPTE